MTLSASAIAYDRRRAEDLDCDLGHIKRLVELAEALIHEAEWRTPVQAEQRGVVSDFAGLLRDALGDTLLPLIDELEERVGALSHDDGRP